MSFTPPPYPYERLDGLKKIAQQFEGGPIDCSIGTPVDPPPAEVLAELARAVGLRGYPSSAGSLDYRTACAQWIERRFGVSLSVDEVAACVGTKEFVGTVSGYLHLRAPSRDTVLFPSISYPTYAMGATLAGLRAVPVTMTDGILDLDSISAGDRDRALVLWSNSPSNPTGVVDDLEGVATWGRQHGVLVASDECYAEYTWEGRPRSILEHGLDGVLAVHSISRAGSAATGSTRASGRSRRSPARDLPFALGTAEQCTKRLQRGCAVSARFVLSLVLEGGARRMATGRTDRATFRPHCESRRTVR